MYNKVIGEVFCTDDLEQFNVLGGNRMVRESHKHELIRSLNEHGYIMNPIIVNENMEVIDGQTRLAACRELKIPVYYVVSPGIGIDECVALNSSAKTWKITDYIQSYADQGNENYKRIKLLIGIGVRYWTVMFTVGIFGGTGRDEKILKEGKAVCTLDTFDKADAALRFLTGLDPILKKISGMRRAVESAIIFAYADLNCNNERLADSIGKYYAMLDGCVDISSALEAVQSAYNRNLKGKKRLYLKEDYERFKRG